MSRDLPEGLGAFGAAAGAGAAAGFGGGGAALAETIGSTEGIGINTAALAGTGGGAEALADGGGAADGDAAGAGAGFFESTEMSANVAITPRSAATTAVAIIALLDRVRGAALARA